MGFRITTWNVNGIRNPFSYQPWREKRTFQAMFDTLEADIVIMQELKIQRKDLRDDMVLVPGWDVYFSLPKHKKGYSGVAIYTRNSTCAPIRAEEGITGCLVAPKTTTQFRDLPRELQIGGYPRLEQLSSDVDEVILDSEGRCVILEFPAFVLLGVYSPANRDESRDDFRLGFLAALDARVRNLVAEGKEVVLAGDLNVIRSELDSTNVAEVLKKNAITMDQWVSMPSRRLFNQLVFEGTVSGERDADRGHAVLWDLTRCFHPTRTGMNTCWDTKKNTRPANNGSRIDYILCSDGLKSWFVGSDIQEGLMGSDHCPVHATLSNRVPLNGTDIPFLDVANPKGMFSNGQRQRDWSQRDLLSLSAKLIPEFDGRRNIRDMFNKSNSTLSSVPVSRSSSLETPSLPSKPVTSTTSIARTSEDSFITTRGEEVNPEPIASSASLQQPLATKRAFTSPDAGFKSKRRKESSDRIDNTKPRAPSGQRTLRAFFKPGVPPGKASENTSENGSYQDASNLSKQQPADTEFQDLNEVDNGTSRTTPLSSRDFTGSFVKVFDPIEAKESWSKLLGKRVVPRCEHDEPCISLTTKKAGVNCGRSFYICPRPLGPSGEKERNTEWRCSTFIWSSDWNGSQS